MKLTGELKEKVEQAEKAESKEEVKQTVKEAGMILSDAELDQVSGGGGIGDIDEFDGLREVSPGLYTDGHGGYFSR